MTTNAHRALRISLAATALLLVFAECSFAAQTYKVRKGDTLQRIAKRFGTTVSVLQDINRLKSANLIRTGQVLTIPSKAANTSPTTYGLAERDDLAVESNGKVITSLSKGDRFVVLERSGDRFIVKLADGRKGWVDASAVTLHETRKPLPASGSWSMKGDIVRLALSYKGARYRRGGMSSRGFDCSGFVKFLYAKNGIKLPHSSRALFKCGKSVAKSDLQAGDLVFFSNTYRRGISHVGIYIGDGKFIHASTARRGVRIDELNADYYRRRYSGARRI